LDPCGIRESRWLVLPRTSWFYVSLDTYSHIGGQFLPHPL
jgi:hypothetical protein